MGRKNFVGCFGICGCAAIVALALGAAPALAQVDNCADGPAVAVDGSNPIDTTAATTDGPDTTGGACSYNNTQIHNDIWFIYTATCDGFLNIDLCGGDGFGPDGVFFDSRVAIYSGTTCPVDATNQIFCNDDGSGCPSFSSAIFESLVVATGAQVLIRVGGFNETESGTGTMGIACTPEVCGDNVQVGAEECDGDDADACNGAACTATCECAEVCGDGVQIGAEECDGDDAAACNGAGCTATCECVEVCGDGIQIGAEECDGDDASACAIACTAACTCIVVTVPALPPIGLIGLAIILLAGGALIFAWRPVRAEAGSE